MAVINVLHSVVVNDREQSTQRVIFSLQRLISVTVEHYGQIDCLVNNAGWREYLLSFSMRIDVVKERKKERKRCPEE